MSERTATMTARLRAHDALMAASDLTPEEQVSVFVVLAILATRRVFVKLGIHGASHGARRKLLRKAIEADFAAKLRLYTMPPVEGAAVEEPSMPEPLPGLGGS